MTAGSDLLGERLTQLASPLLPLLASLPQSFLRVPFQVILMIAASRALVALIIRPPSSLETLLLALLVPLPRS